MRSPFIFGMRTNRVLRRVGLFTGDLWQIKIFRDFGQ